MTRIAVNCESARNGGTRNYLRALLRSAPPDAWTPCFRTPDGTSFQTTETESGAIDAALPTRERLRWDLRTLPSALRAIEASLVFQPSNIRPVGHFSLPMVQVLHNVAPLSRDLRSLAKGRLRLRFEVLHRLTMHALKKASGVVFLSETGLELARDQGFDGRGVVIRPGIEPATHDDHTRARTRSIVVVAHLFRYKRVEDAVMGFARSGLADDGYRLDIYGGLYDRPYVAEVEQLVASSGAGAAVTLHGSVTPERVRRAVREAAVVVQPSGCENAPQIVYEALAESTPIIASSIAAHRELLAHGLFTLGDTSTLATLLQAAAEGHLENQVAVVLPTWEQSANAVVDFCRGCV